MAQQPKMMKALTRQTRHQSRRRQDTNQKRVVWIIVLMLLSIEVPEIPTYVHYLRPEIFTTERDLFLLPGFHHRMIEYWYLKDTADRTAWILRMIAFLKTAVQYSTAVFLSSFLILCYILFDLLMYWVNYNEWPVVYEFIVLFIYIVGRSLVGPYKPEAYGRIKSLF